MNTSTTKVHRLNLLVFVLGVGGCHNIRHESPLPDCASVGTQTYRRLSNRCGDVFPVPTDEPEMTFSRLVRGGKMRLASNGNRFLVVDRDQEWRGQVRDGRSILELDIAVEPGKIAVLSKANEKLSISVQRFKGTPLPGEVQFEGCPVGPELDGVFGGSPPRFSISGDGRLVLLSTERRSVVFDMQTPDCKPRELTLSWAIFWGPGNQILALDSTSQVVLAEMSGRIVTTFSITSVLPPLGSPDETMVLASTRPRWSFPGFVTIVAFEIARPSQVYTVMSTELPGARLYTFIDVREWPRSVRPVPGGSGPN